MVLSRYVARAGCVATAICIAGAGTAEAGGFALKERSARAQGASFAGASAGSGGLSSMGFNPAAIGVVDPEVGSVELSGGLSFIQPKADGAVNVNGTPTGETVDADAFAGLASGYVGYRMEEDILIGLGLYTPFGLVTAYEPGWAGQADALTSQLQTFVFAPTVAWEPNPDLTLALSGKIIYANARLTSSQLVLDGDKISASFGAGVLWEPASGTSVGLGYQHGYGLNLQGTAQSPIGALNGTVAAAAQLPSTVSLGVIQDFGTRFRVMGEVQWQNWSVFDKLDITINGAIPVVEEQNYDDAFFVAVGGEYDVLPNVLTVRAGAAWDQTPTNSGFLAGAVNTTNATNRTARVPDEDRIWLSLGASYAMNDHMTVDVGYSYIFTLEDSIVGLRNAAPGTQVVYEGGAHILSVGGSLKF